MNYDAVVCRKSRRTSPTWRLDFNKRCVKSRSVVWRSDIPEKKRLFPWREGKEVLDWILGLSHSARLTSKSSQLKNFKNSRSGNRTLR